MNQDEINSPLLKGIIYVFADTGYCADIISSLTHTYKKKGPPQLVLCEHLDGFFDRLPGVNSIPMSSSLEHIREALCCLINGYPEIYRYNQIRKESFRIPFFLMQYLIWQRQGVSMSDIAIRAGITLRCAYRYAVKHRKDVGLRTTAECALMSRMPNILLQVRYP